MNLTEAYNLFLSYGRAERNYAPETLGKLRDCFRAWISPQWQEKPVEEIDRQDIIKLRAAMVNRAVGINRQYSILMALKLFLKFCRAVLRLSAFDPGEIQLPQRPRPHVLYLTNGEVERILAAIPQQTFTGSRLRALVILLLNTGLRISEALSLDRKPLDLDQREIEIVGKGGKHRTIFLNEDCVLAAKQYLRHRSDDHPALFVTTGVPRRWSRDDMSKVFVELRYKAQIDKPLTPHLLRHTYCTNLLHHGADITFIKELAGHRDIQTTAKYYLGVDKQALRRVVDTCLDYRPSSPKQEA
jgi:site-specific recombinase XerD